MRSEHNHWAGLVEPTTMPEPSPKPKVKRREFRNGKVISVHVTHEQWAAINWITGGPGKSAWIREAIDQRLKAES